MTSTTQLSRTPEASTASRKQDLIDGLTNAFEDIKLGVKERPEGEEIFRKSAEELLELDLSDGERLFINELEQQLKGGAAIRTRYSPGTPQSGVENPSWEALGLATEIANGVSDTRVAVDATRRASDGGREMMPVRNECRTIDGFIEPFGGSGLVHGGTVHAPTFRLECRSFRWFRHQTTYKGSILKPKFVSTRIVEEVAGICEKFDLNGELVDRWSTASVFPDKFHTTSDVPADGSCAFRLGPGSIFSSSLEGFYVPQDFIELNKAAMQKAHGDAEKTKELLKSGVFLPDTGDLDDKFYGPKSASQFFGKGEDYNTAIENALFTTKSFVSQGFPINTPYLKVFAPDPGFDEVVVYMIGAHRSALRRKRVHEFKRESRWHARVFKRVN